jgi:uncharacterized membrane protein YccC
MSALATLAIGAVGGVGGWAAASFATRQVRRARSAWRAGQDRWSPVDATRAELRLNRRLGRPHPFHIAADPVAYAAWRSDLECATIKRLLDDLKLRLKSGLGLSGLLWSQLTVAERRLVVEGFLHKALKACFGKVSQKRPHKGAKCNDLSERGRPQIFSSNHSSFS